jgi:hypothetical protein
MKTDKGLTMIGSLINLVTLVIGLTVGFLLGNISRTDVRAQAVSAPVPQIEDVAPTMTVGSLGTNLALAHEVDADKIVVNGIDLLRFDQNVIEYLSRRPGAESADLQNLVNASRATVIHRITAPKTPSPIQPATPPSSGSK